NRHLRHVAIFGVAQAQVAGDVGLDLLRAEHLDAEDVVAAALEQPQPLLVPLLDEKVAQHDHNALAAAGQRDALARLGEAGRAAGLEAEQPAAEIVHPPPAAEIAQRAEDAPVAADITDG